tara:strand:+ start:12859 stop:13761 length:903 start_codon:yes stop_codon:yes gene_type:complete
MIPRSYKDYYGDETRWFVGVVKDINDPVELGRVKVRIFGIHSENVEDISDGDLPWAQVAVPITEGGSSGIGTNTGIKPQAQVYGIFLDGKASQLPLVLGSIPKFERIPDIDLTTSSSVPDQVQRPSLTGSPHDFTNPDFKNADETFLVGSTNVEKAFNFFITPEGGSFTPAQACGIIGNFWVESFANRIGDLDVKAQSAPPERSFGIAQWNSSSNAGFRYQNLVEFAAKKNLAWDTLYPQLLFTIHELYESKTYYRLNDLKRATSPEAAAIIFEDRFENPAEKGQVERQKVARDLFRVMA